MAKKADLAIVGGGASAVLLLAAIARNPQAEGFHAEIYDRSGRFGRGIAYSTPHKAHLLNVRAGNMSAFQHDKDDFARWAAPRGYGPSDFVPRMVYGEYLDEKLEEAKGKLSLTFLQSDVETVKDMGNGSYELMAGMRKRDYVCVVQATGNVAPLRPKVEGSVDGYIDDPWTADYTLLAEKQSIALVGSGLSAVDTVLALYSKGYKGKITVVSRHALLPATHTDPVSIEPFLIEEGEKINPYIAFHRIRQRVRDAAQEGIPWQSVVDALRPHTNTVWYWWTRRERERFMKRCFTIWNVHRHRMAPQIAEVVHTLVKVGRLEMLKAPVLKISNGPILHTAAGNIAFDAIINCMGYRTREEGHSFDVFDRIGPARFGDEFETTAIPEIRAQAADIAARIFTKY